MRHKKAAFTLTEIVTAMGLMAFTLFSTLGLFITGLKSYTRTTADSSNSQPLAQAIRRIAETIRPAMTVSVSNSGNTLNYTLPALSANKDPVTGEYEYVYPLVSDGVTRSYSISNGNLVQQPGGRILASSVTTLDPDKSSSQYNQTYTPFQLSPMGSRQSVTIELITQRMVRSQTRYAKYKTTITLQNIR